MNETKPIEGASKKPGKKSPAGKKHGVYTAAVSALVIAIIIIINLIIGGLPSGTLEYDITGKNLYTVTQQSVDFLKTLDKDVSIVVLAQNGAIDERVSKFINNYAKLSPHVSLKIIDPVLDPTALTTYNAKENNVVISCAATNKTKVLNLAGFNGNGDGLILYDYNYYQYYQQLKPVSLDAEGQLTSAVSYVTSKSTNKVYLLNGHDEANLETNASSLISKSNIDTTTLNLLKEGSIPEDCQLVLCFNPQKDLSDDELSMLETYLKNGGHVMLLLGKADLKNFNALLTVYGLQMQTGVVGDTDRYYKAYAQQYGAYCIYPVLSTSSDITSSVTTDAIVLAANGMLQVTPQRRSAVVTPFMTTSDKGVLVVDQNTQKQGQYVIGATSVETLTDKPGKESRLTVISDVNFLSDNLPTGTANFDIFMNAVNKNYSQASSLVIPAKSLDVQSITIANPGIWVILFLVVIPVGVIVGGLIYWSRRRNR